MDVICITRFEGEQTASGRQQPPAAASIRHIQPTTTRQMIGWLGCPIKTACLHAQTQGKSGTPHPIHNTRFPQTPSHGIPNVCTNDNPQTFQHATATRFHPFLTCNTARNTKIDP